MTHAEANTRYRFVPGVGPDPEALARMRRELRKPSGAMGEAWYMGASRKTFDRFVELPIADIPIAELGPFLFEINSGTSAFGASAEWTSWFWYALPDLVVRAHEHRAFHALFEPTVATFLNLNVAGVPAPYREFEDDVCVTLGRCLSKPELWLDGRTPRWDRFLGVRGSRKPSVFWGQTSGDFSAAMFFGLCTFPLHAIEEFLDSIIALEHPAWRARFLTWLWGSARLLREGTPLVDCRPAIEWEDAHVIRSGPDRRTSIVPRKRADLALAHLRERLAPVLASWSFDEVPEIAEAMRELGALGAVRDALF